LTLAELTAQQVTDYLSKTVGGDVYAKLPLEAQTLARNPQDLTLLAEVIVTLGAVKVPTRRADLYREILEHDGALQKWVIDRTPELRVLYSLAFRMVKERRVLRDNQLRDWIADDPNFANDSVDTIVRAAHSSRLFTQERERNVLGQETFVTGFRHELIGKFLAARHVRRAIMADQEVKPVVNYVALSGDRLWLDVFYFVIDEIDSQDALNNFLLQILKAGGSARILIAAYAIGTKPENMVSEEAQRAYENTKLNEDLAHTPAAALTAV
jgi:hypothetical protein